MTKNAGRAWCSDDEGLLAKLRREGHTIRDIAQRLCRSEIAIKKRISELGLPPIAAIRAGRCKPGPTKFDGAHTMESAMRNQDRQFIAAMREAGYVMTHGKTTLNSSGSSR